MIDNTKCNKAMEFMTFGVSQRLRIKLGSKDQDNTADLLHEI